MIEYEGYVGRFEYDPETESFHGEVINTRDVITFVGRSVEELKREMAASIDDYLAWAEQDGFEPSKPYSGRFLVRGTPELHRDVANAAAVENRSMNEWAVRVLSRAARKSLRRVDGSSGR